MQPAQAHFSGTSVLLVHVPCLIFCTFPSAAIPGHFICRGLSDACKGIFIVVCAGVQCVGEGLAE